MRFLLSVSLALVLIAGCGKSNTDADSQTHWLSECHSSAECGANLECVCDRCVQLCEGTVCDVPGRSVQCSPADSAASLSLCASGASHAVCLEPCRTSANCANGTACMDGSCVPETVAGTGGTSASGGVTSSGGQRASGGAGGIAAGGTSSGGSDAGMANAGGTSGGTAGGVGSGGAGGLNCDCNLGLYVAACGVDGQTYDATCGKACVPVEIACDGECPCATQCAAESASCANGETCCAGLTCCVGVPVPAGQEFCGTSCPKSDRALKRGFESVDQNQILEQLAELPISRWSYKTEARETLHLGPMAQDFKQTFGLGESDRTILQVDADGVTFAAVQALYQRLLAVEAKNQALERELEQLKIRAAPAASSTMTCGDRR